MDSHFQEWAAAQTWAEVTTLPADPHHAALMYLATLAYPGDWTARTAAVRTLAEAVKLEYRATRRRRPEWSRPRARPRDIDRHTDQIGRLVLTRLHAAQASALRGSASGPGMAVHGPESVREIAAAMVAGKVRVMIQIGPGARPKRKGPPPDEESIRKAIPRRWKPSKPVLHLARALQESGIPDSGELDVVDLVLRPEWLPLALERLPANAFHLCQQRLVVPADMIWLR